MTRSLSFAVLAASAAVAACGGDSFSVASGAGGAAGAAGAGAGGGASSCLDFAKFGNLKADACTTCINGACNASQIIAVCGKNPADACTADCGTNATCFCDCMTARPAPCGATVSAAYACFTSKCVAACN